MFHLYVNVLSQCTFAVCTLNFRIRSKMDPIETAGNADAGASQPRPADSQPANITVLANRRFPVPPSYYTEFTPERWKKSQRLRAAGALPGKGKEKASEGIITDTEESYMNVDAESDEQSHQRTDVNDLAIFRPPRLDWVKRETTWNAFGRVYQVNELCLRPRMLALISFPLPAIEETKGLDGRTARYPKFQTTRCRMYVSDLSFFTYEVTTCSPMHQYRTNNICTCFCAR